MKDSKRITLPSMPRHYIVVAHGMGEQKINTTIPPVVQRFAEVRQNQKENSCNIIIPSTLSSQSVRSETELHGWSEFRGLPVDARQTDEVFDGAPATETAGENFRFVEMYWQDILQRHQERFASDLEAWTKAMLERLRDTSITPHGWLPAWALPLLSSIVHVAVPLKKMLAFKYLKHVNLVVNGFLGDVHLYGDYMRTRGESVRHFHATLDKLVFYDFLDWRMRELQASRINHEPLVAGYYQKPDITVIAHSLGSIMSFDALIYAYAKREVRKSSSENIEFDSSFPFFGYRAPSREEVGQWKKHAGQIKSFAKDVEKRLVETVVHEFRVIRYREVFDMFYEFFSENGISNERSEEKLEKLAQLLGGGFPVEQWLAKRQESTGGSPHGNEPSQSSVMESAGKARESVEAAIEQIAKALTGQVESDWDVIREFTRQSGIRDASFVERIGQAFESILNNSSASVEALYDNFRASKSSYWNSFLDGFSEIDCEKDRIFEQPDKDEPVKVIMRKSFSVPVLLWRSCVRNFITLGSPIDKYIALWRQNYIHLGFKGAGDAKPAHNQYDFPSGKSLRKIKHYNFYDEQDPVGQHLSITRQSEIYPLIFESGDEAEKRDIVFQRYGCPGLAHNKYWSDGELFSGILQQIIDCKQTDSSIDLTSEKFRKKNNAKKQGLLWAYFRIPLFVSAITAMLLTYSLNNFFNGHQLIGSAIFLVMLFLWFMPGFLRFHKQRTDVENVDKPTYSIIFKSLFSKGLFPLLLTAAVEWRRLLVIQAEGNMDGSKGDKVFLALQYRGDRLAWWDFFWRWGLRFAGAAIALTVLIWLVFSTEYFMDLSRFSGVDRLMWVVGSFFKPNPICTCTPFGDLFTNIAVFFTGALLVIYLLIAVFVCVWFFVIRNRFRGLNEQYL